MLHFANFLSLYYLIVKDRELLSPRKRHSLVLFKLLPLLLILWYFVLEWCTLHSSESLGLYSDSLIFLSTITNLGFILYIRLLKDIFLCLVVFFSSLLWALLIFFFFFSDQGVEIEWLGELLLHSGLWTIFIFSFQSCCVPPPTSELLVS